METKIISRSNLSDLMDKNSKKTNRGKRVKKEWKTEFFFPFTIPTEKP